MSALAADRFADILGARRGASAATTRRERADRYGPAVADLLATALALPADMTADPALVEHAWTNFEPVSDALITVHRDGHNYLMTHSRECQRLLWEHFGADVGALAADAAQALDAALAAVRAELCREHIPPGCYAAQRAALDDMLARADA